MPTQITYLYNLSILQSSVPLAWKVALVTPLQKDGDPTDTNNLRPISLLPLPGKILERLIHSQVMNYLESNNILSKHQGGFRNNHSTLDTIAKFTDDVYTAINSHELTLAVFIDFRKAFDTINHQILLKQLNKLGFDNNFTNWTKDYLTDRFQQTLANGIRSGPRRVTCGVPQGSILGPLFFLVYINDLSSAIKRSQLKLFADDTTIYYSSKNVIALQNVIQQDLLNVAQWCDSNALTINMNKTKLMLFGTRASIQNTNSCLSCLIKTLSNLPITTNTWALSSIAH